MKVYVASSWSDRKQARIIALCVELLGHEITWKWWDHTMPNREKAIRDKQGVIDCDIFIIYNTDKKTGGKMVELGIAIALGKKIHVFGHELTTIFGHLPEVNFEEESKL